MLGKRSWRLQSDLIHLKRSFRYARIVHKEKVSALNYLSTQYLVYLSFIKSA